MTALQAAPGYLPPQLSAKREGVAALPPFRLEERCRCGHVTADHRIAEDAEWYGGREAAEYRALPLVVRYGGCLLCSCSEQMVRAA